jgi:hypothetical protein
VDCESFWEEGAGKKILNSCRSFILIKQLSLSREGEMRVTACIFIDDDDQ